MFFLSWVICTPLVVDHRPRDNGFRNVPADLRALPREEPWAVRTASHLVCASMLPGGAALRGDDEQGWAFAAWRP